MSEEAQGLLNGGSENGSEHDTAAASGSSWAGSPGTSTATRRTLPASRSVPESKSTSDQSAHHSAVDAIANAASAGSDQKQDAATVQVCVVRENRRL